MTGKVYVLITSWVGDAKLLDELDGLLGKRGYEVRHARGSFIQGLLKLAGLNEVPVLPAVFCMDGDVILWGVSNPTRDELIRRLGLEFQVPESDSVGTNSYGPGDDIPGVGTYPTRDR